MQEITRSRQKLQDCIFQLSYLHKKLYQVKLEKYPSNSFEVDRRRLWGRTSELCLLAEDLNRNRDYDTNGSYHSSGMKKGSQD
jgi:hypothetical protein